jgi:hypothetical protein
MATAKRAYGSLIKRETTPASGTYTTITAVTGINWPEMQTDVVETTDMESASATRTRIPTLNSLGDCSFTLNYDSADATHEQLQADCAAQTVRLYKIIGSDTGAADWAFNAYVTKFSVTTERDGLCLASVTLTPTGVVTRT